MLKRLCRTLYHHGRAVSRVEYCDLLKYQRPVVACCRRLRHDGQMVPAPNGDRSSKAKEDFLSQYPSAFKYEGSFSIEVQPFSIDMPHLFLRNFINDLGHTMKIPYVYEDGYSAALCLEKICQTRDEGNHTDEGITREEWHEIYLAIDDEIPYLDGRTLASLVSLYFKGKQFRKDCFEKLYLQFSQMLTYSDSLSVADLCLWSNTLRKNECFNPQFTKLLNTIWDIICSKKLKAEDLLTVYQAVPPQHKHLYEKFYEPFKLYLPKMKVYDLFMIGMELEQKSDRTIEFQLMVGWIQKNLHLINSEDLKDILSNFNAAGYVDAFLLEILCEYLNKYTRQCKLKGKPIDKRFIELTLEYSTISCFYEPNILEIACHIYIDSEADYTYEELVILLKALGTLNHTPRRAFEFFTKVETFLLKEAMNMSPVTLLEMAEYLLYIDRPLFCLKDMIFSPSFQGFIGKLKSEDQAAYRKNLLRMTLLWKAFQEINFDPFPRLCLLDKDVYQRLNVVEYKDEKVYNVVATALKNLIPVQKIGHYPRPSYEENYIELQYDRYGMMLPAKHPDSLIYPRYRKAIIILGHEAFCSMNGTNASNHMIGTERVNINILKNQNVEVHLLKKMDIMDRKQRASLELNLEKIIQADPLKIQEFFSLQKEVSEERKETLTLDPESTDFDSEDLND